MAKKKKIETEPRVLRPARGSVTKAEIEALLANANGASAPAVTHLKRQDISAAADGVFQQRRYEDNSIRSAAHIATLAKVLTATGEPLRPIPVFWAGDRFFAVDGHHRLAAYEAVNWKDPIPVEVFEGSLEQARRAAIQHNIEDKLPLTKSDKFNVAWRLIKEHDINHLSKADITRLTTVATGTITAMRAKWQAIKDAGDERLLAMDWEHARRWQPGGDGRDDHDDGWREQMIEQLKSRLIASGIASAMGKYPDFVMEAVSRINPDTVNKLAMAIGPDAVDWLQAQHHQDPIDPSAMHDF
jgi:ParB-like nuclease domain